MNLKECDLRLNLKLSDLVQDMDEGSDWVTDLNLLSKMIQLGLW